ncbi:MAG: HEAT repeat domain-containing protein [Sandaracinus sp.]
MAIVSVEPSSTGAELWLVRVARGQALGALSLGSVYGPYPTGTLAARFDDVVASLKSEGFAAAAHSDLVQALQSPRREVRARAAVALGWRRDRAAGTALLHAAHDAKHEIPLILEALGQVGETSAIPLLREYAGRKLLSRRRSAVEALRLLGDAEGLAASRQASLERLPDAVRNALAPIDENDLRKSTLAPVLAAIDSVSADKRGAMVDALYELDTPASNALARHALKELPVASASAWRYVKSVWRRAMLRGDAQTFALTVHAMDRARRKSKGSTATVKSGLDGESRPTRIFGKKTQRWVIRASLRHLRKLAKWRPGAYARTAATLLARYSDEDLAAWSESIVLHAILAWSSDRVRFTRALKVRWASAAASKLAPKAREEAFPELWDATPEAYLVALEGRSRPVLDFALAGVARHPALPARLDPGVIVELLGSRHEGVIALASAEIERRFLPSSPEVGLLARMLDHESAAVRAKGLELARRSTGAWLRTPERAVKLLLRPGAEARTALASIAIEGARALTDDERAALAARVITAITQRVADTAPDAPLEVHELWQALVDLVAGALTKESRALVSEDQALAWLASLAPPLRTLGAARLLESESLVPRLRDADGGFSHLASLANDALVIVRKLAHLALRDAIGELSRDPSLLLSLVESPHRDTREAAFDVLRAVPIATLGLEGITVLCDATGPDAQALGRELATKGAAEIDLGALLFRLAESPHAGVRRFAIALAESHLRPGLVPLMRLDDFARAVLFDARPDRDTKRRLLALLERRGLASRAEGEHVAALLSKVVRTHARGDFDRIVSILATLSVTHPGLATPLAIEGSA